MMPSLAMLEKKSPACRFWLLSSVYLSNGRTNQRTTMNQYMIVLHGKPSEWKKHSEEDQKHLIGRYMAWVEKLKADGRFKRGSELHPTHRDLKTVNNKIVVDGPFPESKE